MSSISSPDMTAENAQGTQGQEVHQPNELLFRLLKLEQNHIGLEARILNLETYIHQEIPNLIGAKINDPLIEQAPHILGNVKEEVCGAFNTRMDNLANQQSVNLTKLLEETTKKLSESEARWAQDAQNRAEEHQKALRTTKDSLSKLIGEAERRVNDIKDSSIKNQVDTASKISQMVTPESLSLAINLLRGEILRTLQDDSQDKADSIGKLEEKSLSWKYLRTLLRNATSRQGIKRYHPYSLSIPMILLPYRRALEPTNPLMIF